MTPANRHLLGCAAAMIVASAIACGAGRPAEAPLEASVSAVDGGAVVSSPTESAATPEELASVLASSLRVIDDYLAQCKGSDPPTLSRVRQAQAALYADRDEVHLRQARDDGWTGRDIADWTRQARAREAELRSFLRGCTTPR